jgi:hypothetical protein
VGAGGRRVGGDHGGGWGVCGVEGAVSRAGSTSLHSLKGLLRLLFRVVRTSAGCARTTLRFTPAMKAGTADHVWEVEELVQWIE